MRWVQGSPTARKYSQLSSPATLGLTFFLFPSGASDKTILNRFILAYPVGAPRKKQVERLAFFYPIRRFGMESPHEERCMESVAKRRHGITHWRVFSSDWFHPYLAVRFHTRLAPWFHSRLCRDFLCTVPTVKSRFALPGVPLVRLVSVLRNNWMQSVLMQLTLNRLACG